MNQAEGEKLAASVAVAPRVSLADIECKVLAEYHFRAADATDAMDLKPPPFTNEDPYRTVQAALGVLSICILVMKNGFTVIGKSAPASVANFDAEVGKKFAREDAIRQLWPLEGYALRDRLAE